MQNKYVVTYIDYFSVSSKNTTPSRDAMTKWAKSGKKSKKKFKRSLTMTALPLSFFKGTYRFKKI